MSNTIFLLFLSQNKVWKKERERERKKSETAALDPNTWWDAHKFSELQRLSNYDFYHTLLAQVRCTRDD